MFYLLDLVALFVSLLIAYFAPQRVSYPAALLVALGIMILLRLVSRTEWYPSRAATP